MSDPDIRKSELKENAGLDESRLNTEFIEMLQKWSSPVLFAIALIVLAYWGWGQLKVRQNNKINEAYQQFSQVASSANPNPASLRVVADEYGGERSIGIQSRLREADVYLEAVRTGLAPGASGAALGQEIAEEDKLTDEDRTKYIEDARRLYERVISEAGATPGQRIHAISAAFGLAAIAEHASDRDAANAAYDRAAELANEGGFPELATISKNRKDSVDASIAGVTLPASDELPRPEPAAIDPADAEQQADPQEESASSDDEESSEQTETSDDAASSEDPPADEEQSSDG